MTKTLARRVQHLLREDRGSVSLEQAVVTGGILLVAGLVLTAIGALVATATGMLQMPSLGIG